MVEALELARACVARSANESLTDRLKAIGVSKDYYYRRNEEFRAFTGGLDLTSEIDRAVAARGNPRSDLIARYGEVHDLLDRLKTAGLRPRRLHVRAGVSESLSRPLANDVVRRFRNHEAAGGGVEVETELGISGDLHREFDAGLLDLFVSQVTEQYQNRSDGTEVRGAKQSDADGPSIKVSRAYTLPFQFVCPHRHPAAEHIARKPGEGVPADELKGTLVLIGYHPRRRPQYVFPRDVIGDRFPALRVIEVETFTRAHLNLLSGRDDVAVLTIPEFLDDECLRTVTPIPLGQIPDMPAVSPLHLHVVWRRPDPGAADPRGAAVDRLAEAFEAGLRDLADDDLARDAADWLGPARHIYYERSGETAGRRPLSRGWAHSVIRWQVLKNGRLVGRHTVDGPRAPNTGAYGGDGTTFDVHGRLLRNPGGDEYHLIWSGLDEGREAYAASFVIPADTFRAGRFGSGRGRANPSRDAVDPARDVVGIWTGRRTSASAYEPSAGSMVITLQPEDWHIPVGGEGVPEEAQRRVLTHLRAAVRRHEGRFPGLQPGDPADRWEWTNAQDAEPSADQRLLELLSQVQPGLRQLGALEPVIERLAADLKADSAKPAGRRKPSGGTGR